MKAIAALIAAGLAGCAPIEEQTEPPVAHCHADRTEVDALLGELAVIAAEVEAGAVAAAARRMAAVLDHSVFRTQEGRPAVDVSGDPRAFAEWWQRGGESWAQGRLYQSATDTESPPTIRSVIDADAVPAEILCATPTCDPKASGFIATVVAWGLEREAYERGRFFAPGPMLNNWQQQCGVSSATEWLDCVARRRSARAELPLGDYRFPTSGWFFVSRYSLLRTECPSYLGVNLETGEVRSANDCQVREGRGSVERFREFALLTLLAGQAEDIAAVQRLQAPDGIDLSGTCSLDSAPPPQRVWHSAHARLAYWWWRDVSVAAEGIRNTDAYEEPASELALKLFRVAEYTVVDGSASLAEEINSSDRDLADLLAALRGERDGRWQP